jgi:hypothetical protein
MGQYIFYHNITQQKFNLDLEDLCDSILENNNDIIMHSIAGNACILPLDASQKEEIDIYLKENY